MGRAARGRPERLAEKLKLIRESLGLSQSQIWRRLELEERVGYKVISGYETGMTEPPLLVLLAYARLAGVCLDYLVDDRLDLPSRLPATIKHRVE